MIPILQNEFHVLLGRLGGWPSDCTADAAVALYKLIMSLPKDAIVIDVYPVGGKTTVIAAGAAMRSGAKVMAVYQMGLSPDDLWFTRAVRLFKMEIPVAPSLVNVTADVVICHGNEKLARNVYGEGLRPDGFLFGLNMESIDGVPVHAQGHGWKVWKKEPAKTKIDELLAKLEGPGSFGEGMKIAYENLKANGAIKDAEEAIIVLPDNTESEEKKPSEPQNGDAQVVDGNGDREPREPAAPTGSEGEGHEPDGKLEDG